MKICVIYNPRSGISQNWLTINPLETIINYFSSQQIPITIKSTLKQGNGTHLARESVNEGYTHIIACGGDGTINEVVNGIINTESTLGIIPFGTNNVLAAAMDIPEDVLSACQFFMHSNEKKMDVAVANGRNYLIVSGMGFDAQVIEELSPNLKGTFGTWSYILKGAEKILTSSEENFSTNIKIELFDQDRVLEFQAWVVVVANIAHYSRTIKIASKAKPDDGKLDIVVFPSPGDSGFDLMRQLYATLTESPLEDSNIWYFQSSHFRITADPPIPCQTDGEIIGNTPIEYFVKHNALKIRC
jgi:YegS/Rv2252/BmrU family lipid kinase